MTGPEIGISDIRLTIIEDRPKGGHWHCGPNACWVEAEHVPTGCRARAFSESQHRARDAAVFAVQFLVAETRGDQPSFPSRLVED